MRVNVSSICRRCNAAKVLDAASHRAIVAKDEERRNRRTRLVRPVGETQLLGDLEVPVQNIRRGILVNHLAGKVRSAAQAKRSIVSKKRRCSRRGGAIREVKRNARDLVLLRPVLELLLHDQELVSLLAVRAPKRTCEKHKRVGPVLRRRGRAEEPLALARRRLARAGVVGVHLVGGDVEIHRPFAPTKFVSRLLVDPERIRRGVLWRCNHRYVARRHGLPDGVEQQELYLPARSRHAGRNGNAIGQLRVTHSPVDPIGLGIGDISRICHDERIRRNSAGNGVRAHERNVNAHRGADFRLEAVAILIADGEDAACVLGNDYWRDWLEVLKFAREVRDRLLGPGRIVLVAVNCISDCGDVDLAFRPVYPDKWIARVLVVANPVENLASL